MAETRVYKRRRPERTDYYRIIESRFEELERMWPECFEQKYGYLRKEVVRAIYAFLDYGIPKAVWPVFIATGAVTTISWPSPAA